MRLSIRAKQITGVTVIVGLAVIVLSGVHITRLAQVGLDESQARGELLANAIFHRVRQIVSESADPYTDIRTDPGLLALLQSSVYGRSVIDAGIFDAFGRIVAHSDPARVGQSIAPRGDLSALVTAPTLDQFRVIYSSDGPTLEVRQPMLLADESFGSIRVGISTLLLRQELAAAVRPALYTAAAALLVAVFVAGLLAQLLLRPIHVIRSGLTRLGQGESGITLDLPSGDEFGELGSFFNTVSRQLSDDRSALADQKSHLQSAVEHIEDAVALFDPSGGLLFSNPAMQPILPVSGVGATLASLLPEGHPYRRAVEGTLTTRRASGPVQAHVEDLRADGSEVAHGDRLLLTHAIADGEGQLVGVLLVSRDLSYLARVQSTIAYSRKLIALGRLTAGVAHEVKNPLNAMMIHLELLRTKLRAGALRPVEDPAPVAAPAAAGLGLSVAGTPDANLAAPTKAALDHVRVIEDEVRRLDEVVQGFLKFSRPEELRLQPVRLGPLCAELLPVLEPDATRHQVVVEVVCPETVPPVNADAAMLRQALLNLAINGCQAMPDGGTLRIACAAASAGRVEIRVSDTGVGITAEHLSRIFDLYFTTKDHGTGIGLSMVYRIVQLHDGEIDVESTPGRGTTFLVLLPRAQDI